MKTLQTFLVIAALVPFAACTTRENQALRSGEPNMAPNGSAPLKTPPASDDSKPSSNAGSNPVLAPIIPERSDALTKEGYSDTAPTQTAGGPEDLHTIVGTRLQSDRGRLHTTGAAPGVSNPSTDTQHKTDINRNVENSKK
jgi:hypothetical protein